MLKPISTSEIDLITVTMTAELSDAYFSKCDGVKHILGSIESIFPYNDVRVLTMDGRLLSIDEARVDPLKVAAANWYATGWLVSKISDTALAMDTGSTTTSIIPVYNGRVVARGMNDLEKLTTGELIYTGALRTNVVAIVHELPYKGILVPVSSEYFAQSGDVHLLLRNIDEKDYNVDTPDGRGVSFEECAARLARVICADLDMLNRDDVISIARYIYDKQIFQVVNGLKKVINNFSIDFREYPAYVTGLGARFLDEIALRKLGFKRIVKLKKHIGIKGARATPSYALALIGMDFLNEGCEFKAFEEYEEGDRSKNRG